MAEAKKSTSKKSVKPDDEQVTKAEYFVLVAIVGGLVILTAIYVNRMMETRGLLAPEPSFPMEADDSGPIEFGND